MSFSFRFCLGCIHTATGAGPHHSDESGSRAAERPAAGHACKIRARAAACQRNIPNALIDRSDRL
jgi:hypothetical protein